MGMMGGTLVRWGSERGFGFLRRDDGAGELFLHISELQRAGLGTPVVGERFMFDVGTRHDGRTFATDIRRGREAA